MKLLRVLISTVVVLGGVELRASEIATYSTLSGFTGAFSGGTFTNINFNSYAGTDIFTPYTDASGVVVSSSSGVLHVLNPLGGGWGSTDAVVKNGTGGSGTTISISSFPTGARGFALYVGEAGIGVADLTLSYTSGSTYTYSLTPGSTTSPVFFGTQTDAAITNLTLTSNYSFTTLEFNGLQFVTPSGGGGGGGSPTPETATSILLGAGLVALGLMRKFSPRGAL